MSEEESRMVFSKLDLTGDGEVQYSEFLAAACQRRFLSQESLIKDAFRRFDVDKSGVISVDDLRAVLGDEYNGTRVEEILAQVDAGGDGVIDYDEFVKALMDLGTCNNVSESPTEQLGWLHRISRAFEFMSSFTGHPATNVIEAKENLQTRHKSLRNRLVSEDSCDKSRRASAYQERAAFMMGFDEGEGVKRRSPCVRTVSF
mmetsp:Transcript_8487/g.21693  ORF Transcript_8487/g.21693 Transcript_8487/m.21693 type:complete len:202 (+) Transcript_8487:79-684(+)